MIDFREENSGIRFEITFWQLWIFITVVWLLVRTFFAIKNKKIDVIVFDPPRKGCDEKFLNTVIKSGIKKIVYISCKTSTFARDIKILCDSGYKVLEVTPFDLFSHSIHTECCGVLVKE